MTRPMRLDRSSDLVPVVCPKCLDGHVVLHFALTDLKGKRVQIPRYLSCTRSKSCGWWELIEGET